MTTHNEPERPWLVSLATEQRGQADELVGVRYDDNTQMTYLQEPNIPIIDTDHRSMTKKADREVGEDQK